MKVQIKDLKKKDRFIHNNALFYVTKKYINDESPLKAMNQETHREHLYFLDELEIEKVIYTG